MANVNRNRLSRPSLHILFKHSQPINLRFQNKVQWIQKLKKIIKLFIGMPFPMGYDPLICNGISIIGCNCSSCVA
jgi:hypothetical protein